MASWLERCRMSLSVAGVTLALWLVFSPIAAEAQAETGSAAALSPAAATASPVAGAETPADLTAGTAPAAAHKPTGQADRTLMKRSTYCGVNDTGPVPGETFEQKVARLARVSAAAKQRAEGG